MIERGTVLGLAAALVAGCSMLPGNAGTLDRAPDRVGAGPQLAAQANVASLVVPPSVSDHVEQRLKRLEEDLARVRTEFQEVRPGIDRLVRIEGDIRILLAELSSLSGVQAAAAPNQRTAQAVPARASAPAPSPPHPPVPALSPVSPRSGGPLQTLRLPTGSKPVQVPELRPVPTLAQPQPPLPILSASVVPPPPPTAVSTPSTSDPATATDLHAVRGSNIPSPEAGTTAVVQIVPW